MSVYDITKDAKEKMNIGSSKKTQELTLKYEEQKKKKEELKEKEQKQKEDIHNKFLKSMGHPDANKEKPYDSTLMNKDATRSYQPKPNLWDKIETGIEKGADKLSQIDEKIKETSKNIFQENVKQHLKMYRTLKKGWNLLKPKSKSQPQNKKPEVRDLMLKEGRDYQKGNKKNKGSTLV